MNETYISLVPSEQSRLESQNRARVANHRVSVALGQPFTLAFGIPFALGNFFMAYHFLDKFSSKGKTFQLILLAGSSLLGYHAGQSIAAAYFADVNFSTLVSRRSAYIVRISGKGPIDPDQK